MKLKCEHCKRTIRSNNRKAVFLFLRSGDVEVWVCSPRCLKKYNEGVEVAPCTCGAGLSPHDSACERITG